MLVRRIFMGLLSFYFLGQCAWAFDYYDVGKIKRTAWYLTDLSGDLYSEVVHEDAYLTHLTSNLHEQSAKLYDEALNYRNSQPGDLILRDRRIVNIFDDLSFYYGEIHQYTDSFNQEFGFFPLLEELHDMYMSAHHVVYGEQDDGEVPRVSELSIDG